MAGQKKPKSKSKHRNVQIWKKYRVEAGKALMAGKWCPRCGPGVSMAQHRDRIACGRCGYAELEKK
jgi:small subunit ribosomal protein S27Ae